MDSIERILQKALELDQFTREQLALSLDMNFETVKSNLHRHQQYFEEIDRVSSGGKGRPKVVYTVDKEHRPALEARVHAAEQEARLLLAKEYTGELPRPYFLDQIELSLREFEDMGIDAVDEEDKAEVEHELKLVDAEITDYEEVYTYAQVVPLRNAYAALQQRYDNLQHSKQKVAVATEPVIDIDDVIMPLVARAGANTGAATLAALKEPARVIAGASVVAAITKMMPFAPGLTSLFRLKPWMSSTQRILRIQLEREKFHSDLDMFALDIAHPVGLMAYELDRTLIYSGRSNEDIVRRSLGRLALSQEVGDNTAAQNVAQEMLDRNLKQLTISVLPGYTAWRAVIEEASSMLQGVGIELTINDKSSTGNSMSQKYHMAADDIDVGIVALGAYLARDDKVFLPRKYNLSRPAGHSTMSILRMGVAELQNPSEAKIYALDGSSAGVIARRFARDHTSVSYAPLYYGDLQAGHQPTISTGDYVVMADIQARFAQSNWAVESVDTHQHLTAIVWHKAFCRPSEADDQLRHGVEQLFLNAWRRLKRDNKAFNRLVMRRDQSGAEKNWNHLFRS